MLDSSIGWHAISIALWRVCQIRGKGRARQPPVLGACCPYVVFVFNLSQADAASASGLSDCCAWPVQCARCPCRPPRRRWCVCASCIENVFDRNCLQIGIRPVCWHRTLLSENGLESLSIRLIALCPGCRNPPLAKFGWCWELCGAT